MVTLHSILNFIFIISSNFFSNLYNLNVSTEHKVKDIELLNVKMELNLRN